MTLDEAIKHCEEEAKELREKAKIYKGQFLWERDAEYCQKCAEEHEQLAEWLKELKALKERPQGDFTRNELESWLYRIASNNLDNELGRSCEEIICRLNGFERFVSDMRKGGAK